MAREIILNGRTYKIALFPGRRRLDLQRKWSTILMPAAGHMAGAIKLELGDSTGITDMMSMSVKALSLNGDQIAAAAGLLAAAPEALILETFELTYAMMPNQNGSLQEFQVKQHFDAVFKEVSTPPTVIDGTIINGPTVDHYADLFPLLIAVLKENFGPLVESLKELLGPIGRIFKRKTPATEPSSSESSSSMPQV